MKRERWNIRCRRGGGRAARCRKKSHLCKVLGRKKRVERLGKDENSKKHYNYILRQQELENSAKISTKRNLTAENSASIFLLLIFPLPSFLQGSRYCCCYCFLHRVSPNLILLPVQGRLMPFRLRYFQWDRDLFLIELHTWPCQWYSRAVKDQTCDYLWHLGTWAPHYLPKPSSSPAEIQKNRGKDVRYY